jgi:hypothetical protein
MTEAEIFKVWAPPLGVWSPWCKPVLFAHLYVGDEYDEYYDERFSDEDYDDDDHDYDDDDHDPEAPPDSPAVPKLALELDGVPSSTERVAIVVDLPGAMSVNAGLILAERLGYRPVPLFNAAPPAPPYTSAQVDVRGTMEALLRGTETLAKLPIDADAPPVFLLDAHRRHGADGLPNESFDNRSVSFPTDFPSANRLLSRGIRSALVIQTRSGEVEADLAHTLRRFQEAGIVIRQKALDSSTVETIDVAKPSWFRSAWHYTMERAGLRRNVLGGFGGWLSEGGAG